MKKGFTLLETLLAIFLITIIFFGLFGAFELGIRLSSHIRARVTAISLANLQIEKIRNLPYKDIGINKEGVIPQGVVEESFEITINGIPFLVENNITYVVNCADGVTPDGDPCPSDAEGKCPQDPCPQDLCPFDYKRVEVKVSWKGFWGGEVKMVTDIAPRSIAEECQEEGGMLSVRVFDSKGVLVSSPLIEVKDPETDTLIQEAIPEDGKFLFVLPTSTYKVVVSKTDYTKERTYGVGEEYNGQTIYEPENPNPIVLENQLTEISLSIDQISKFLIYTYQAKANHIYYVRTSGSDENDGLSPDTAFLTIQKAVNTAQAGDFIFVGAGTYQEEVSFPNSGTQDNPIVVVADVEGEYTGDAGEVVIEGVNYGFVIDGQDNIKIYGFTLRGASLANIYLNNTSNIYLSSLNIAQSQGDGIIIDNSNNIELVNNTVENNQSNGILIQNSSKIQINNNKVFTNQLNGISADNLLSSTIKSNLIIQNQEDGIEIASSQIEILNNTFYQNQESGISLVGSPNVVIQNNIIVGSDKGIEATDSSEAEVSYNDFWQNTQDATGIVLDETNIFDDPFFVDASNYNFHLSSTEAGQTQDSPCIDAGSDLASNLSLSSQTTRTDNIKDTDIVDLGYHYFVTLPKAPSPFGASIGNVSFLLQGEKIVGKDENQNDILKYQATHQTDETGYLLLDNMEWDSYTFSDFTIEGENLSLIISWPSAMPIKLYPGIEQTVKLGLRASDSLYLQILDSQDLTPIFNAKVRLHNQSYDKTLFTNQEGEVLFIPLESGVYSLDIEADGYESYSDTLSIMGNVEKVIYLKRS